MNTIYLNGQFMPAEQAQISPLDRGFLFADGAYEVVPGFSGVLFRLEEHLQRLERSLRELKIANPLSRDEWRALCKDLVARNGGGNVSVYLQVTRGAAPKRDHLFPAPAVPSTVFMSVSPLSLTPIHAVETFEGAKAIVRDDQRWSRCDIKSVSLLPNIMLRQEALEAGAVEAIQIRDGLVTEGSSTNVFVVQQGRIMTPPLSNFILGGVTRGLVLELGLKHGMAVEERQITRAELLAADEIWVTSSTKDVLPIVALDDQAIGTGRPGPVWQQVGRLYLAYKREVCGID